MQSGVGIFIHNLLCIFLMFISGVINDMTSTFTASGGGATEETPIEIDD